MINSTTPGFRATVAALGFAGFILSSTAWSQTSSSVRIRGTIEQVNGETLHVKTRSGADAAVQLATDATVTGLVEASWADIKPGSYVGTAAVEQPTGNLKSIEVQVFPESMRGVGEGHREYDLGPKSSMTNGTVGQVVQAGDGRTLTIMYQGKEKTVVVPPDAPIVTYVPSDRTDLAPGAKVIVTAMKRPDGMLQASRVLVGKNGLEPPM
ncbi:hypothetical protein [Microvirga massiliensis]|uniref:hypothetical protein n=1 Tax=Microvirga massiliensis TaxID=1033741 RepID=UPI00062B450F|nr:hypothetical protein [Microvirga massiliensis]